MPPFPFLRGFSLPSSPFRSLPVFHYFHFSLFTSFAQSLPRSTPEEEGVSSKAIRDWIKSYDTPKHELHSIMVLRHGKVIAEGWAKPYAANEKHTMYSVSKSWTSTAIGFLVDEGKLKVTDKVIDIFPEYKDIQTNKYLNDISVKDLLTMSVGHKIEPLRSVVSSKNDWKRTFLAAQIDNLPGSKFLYNTGATYMLSAIIQKISGQKTLDYLNDKLLKPLEISEIDWETDPAGINTGGWGIRVKTEDMAKLGQLYLQKGKWKGKQILSTSWINEATSKQIEQDPSATQAQKDSSDWLQGYGYQFWRCRNGAFRADGAFGQYIVVFPEKDAVVIITSESMDLAEDLNNIWQHLLPAFLDNKLAKNELELGLLTNDLKNLKLSSPISTGKENKANLHLGNEIHLNSNDLQLETLKLEETKMGYNLILKDTNQNSFSIPLQNGKFEYSETNFKGPYLLRSAQHALEGINPYKVGGSYYWNADGTLGITLRYYQSPHHWDWVIRPVDAGFELKVINSFDKIHPILIKGA